MEMLNSAIYDNFCRGHRWMHKAIGRDGRIKTMSVGLKRPLSTDFCFHCKNYRSMTRPRSPGRRR